MIRIVNLTTDKNFIWSLKIFDKEENNVNFVMSVDLGGAPFKFYELDKDYINGIRLTSYA